MPRATDLKNGMVIDINGVPHVVKQIQVKSPSARGAATLYHIRYNNMQTGQKLDETYKGDDMLKDADFARELAAGAGLATPALECTAAAMRAAAEAGLGDLDFSVIGRLES